MKNEILDYEKFKTLTQKKDLMGPKAIEAVKQNGYALRYVKEQTEAICTEAVKQNGYALRYVEWTFISNGKPTYTKEDISNFLGKPSSEFNIVL